MSTYRAEIVLYLMPLLSDQDAKTRCPAIETVGHLKELKALETVVLRLSDSDKNVRCSAAKALGILGNPAVFSDLVKALDDEFSDVRHEVIIALGKIGDLDAIAHLSKILSSESSDNVSRCYAAQSLGLLNSWQSYPPLINALQDKSRTLQRSATQALDTLIRSINVIETAYLLKHPDPSIRGYIAEALETIKAPQALPALIASQNDPDQWVQGRIQRTLHKTVETTKTENLILLVRDKDLNVQNYIIGVLEHRGSREVVNALFKLLKQPEKSARYCVMHVINQIRFRPLAIPLFTKALDDQDVLIKNVAGYALYCIGTPEALAALPDWFEPPKAKPGKSD